jgi:hypothetical protein
MTIRHRPVIYELGAYHGEDTEWVTGVCAGRGGCNYVVVEADPENARVILGKMAPGQSLNTGRSGVRFAFFDCAIADHDGVADFHICANSIGHQRGSGSIRHPTGHLTHFPWCHFPKVLPLPCMTLDSLYLTMRRLHDRAIIDFLWSDLQGAERDMIAGGRAALANTRYLFMEAEPEVELYAGQALKAELISMLPEWDVLEDFGYNILLRNRRLNTHEQH